MTNFHPLTEKIMDAVDTKHDFVDADQIDALVREALTPPPVVAGSGVRFPDMPDTLVSVAGNFITSGNQMQMVLVGTEPILIVQPEYDEDENEVTLITTAVDLQPGGLVHVLESLLDGVREIVRIQTEQARDELMEARSTAIDAGNAGL